MDISQHSENVANRLLIERRRQINQEGWTPEHDDEHDQGELAKAAMCFANGEVTIRAEHSSLEFSTVTEIILDPFLDVTRRERGVQKVTSPLKKSIEKKSRIRQLEIAGAFIIAEIERLERLEMNQPSESAPG